MKECICVGCGTTFYSERDRKFCSTRCYKTYWQSARRKNTKSAAQWTCPMNEGVICRIRTCTSCGWNPDVSQKRLLNIKQRLGYKV